MGDKAADQKILEPVRPQPGQAVATARQQPLGQ